MRLRRALLAFAFGLIGGLGGQALLFLEKQCLKIEGALISDFRILLFLGAELDAGRLKVIEEGLWAIPDVAEVRVVSKQEALSALRLREPELVESIALVSDNPLKPAYEVRLARRSLSRVPQWIAQAQGVAPWADVRYKPAQVEAILQAQFYGYFIQLALSAMACVTALMVLGGLWPSGKAGGKAWTGPGGRWEAIAAAGLAAGVGGMAGAAVTSLMVLPMRLLTPWWAWPSAAKLAVLLVGVSAAGGALCAKE